MKLSDVYNLGKLYYRTVLTISDIFVSSGQDSSGEKKTCSVSSEIHIH
jgi:hypothetical protein